ALRRQSAEARSRSRHEIQHVRPRWLASDADRAARASLARCGDEPAVDAVPLFRRPRRRDERILRQSRRPQSCRGKIPERCALTRAHAVSTRSFPHAVSTRHFASIMFARTGRFITLEGIDGAGKSTHMPWIAGRIESTGQAIVTTREPGGTPLGEALRTLILREPMTHDSEADRKSTRLNSSHRTISYAVLCL